MSTAMFYLILTAGLGIFLWIPHVVGLVMTNGFLTPENYRDITREKQPNWVERANRVLCNYTETIAPFAILVIAAQILFAKSEPALLVTVGFWAQIFFWARVVHAVVYWFGIPYIRTLAFVVGVVAVAAIFIQFVTY